MTRTITLSVFPLIALFFCGYVRADITVGSFTFDDLAFADDATQIDTGTISLFGGAADLDDALTGYSPGKAIVNIGLDTNANHFQLDFTDLLAINASGADLVFFDARFSEDPYEIAVREVGSDFSDFVPFVVSDFVNTGVIGPGPSFSILYALPIELDEFGLATGAVVDAIQFRSLPNASGSNNGDPVMAAVLNGTPPGPGTIVVDIDIKPGDDTNSVNLASSGMIPVAILSSAEFDATQVDPETVSLAGSGVAVRGKGNKLLAQIDDANGDGLNDLVMLIETQNLDPGQFQDGSAILTGSTFGGQAFTGSDAIFIVPPQ